MPHMLTHAQPSLPATSPGRATLVVWALLTVGALLTPLVQIPGYELAELLTLFNAAVAGPLAIVGVPRGEPSAALGAALKAFGFLVILDALTVGAVAARAAFGSHCSPFAGMPFLGVLPLPTALLTCCLGAGLSVLIAEVRLASALYWLGVLGLLVHAAWPTYAGPQAFSYDHLLGYFPGPLYDETLTLPRALWMFRLLTVGFAVLSLPVLRAAPALVPFLFGGALFFTGPLEHRLGTRSSVADLDRALGATRSFGALTIHFPRELPAKRAGELLRLAAVDRAQVAEALGLPEDLPVDVFFHRSAEEKRTLTGAGQVEFTKPWLHQIQIEVESSEVLRHEMVHALAASFAGGPFGVGRPLIFNIGVVEGLAEAIDWPVSAYTVDEWAAGLKASGFFVAPKALLKNSPAFYAAPQLPAYVVAGAFLKYLLTTYGTKAVQTLYRDESFEKGFGAPLAKLSDDFEASLAKTTVSPQLLHAAQERFRQRALFTRPCGREVAALKDEAAELDGRGDHAQAAQLFGRCAALDPGEPRYLEERWQALRRAHDPKAAQALAELLASPAVDDAVRARVAVERGTQAMRDGHPEQARQAFEEARALGVDSPTRRALEVRLLALPFPDLVEPLHRALDESPDDLALLALSEAANDHPLFGPLPYLLGLRLAGRGEWEWAMRELDEALDLGLPDDLAAQALRVQIRSAMAAGKLDSGAASLDELQGLDLPAAQQVITKDLADQLALTRKLFPTR